MSNKRRRRRREKKSREKNRTHWSYCDIFCWCSCSWPKAAIEFYLKRTFTAIYFVALSQFLGLCVCCDFVFKGNRIAFFLTRSHKIRRYTLNRMLKNAVLQPLKKIRTQTTQLDTHTRIHTNTMTNYARAFIHTQGIACVCACVCCLVQERLTTWWAQRRVGVCVARMPPNHATQLPKLKRKKGARNTQRCNNNKMRTILLSTKFYFSDFFPVNFSHTVSIRNFFKSFWLFSV